MKKYIMYTHPSACGYIPEVTYEYDEVVKDIGLDKVKILFTPLNFKWIDIENPTKENKLNK